MKCVISDVFVPYVSPTVNSMSVLLGPDMPVPVPKPRTRYKRAGGSPQIHLSSDR